MICKYVPRVLYNYTQHAVNLALLHACFVEASTFVQSSAVMV